jgi:hypothetical protein
MEGKKQSKTKQNKTKQNRTGRNRKEQTNNGKQEQMII